MGVVQAELIIPAALLEPTRLVLGDTVPAAAVWSNRDGARFAASSFVMDQEAIDSLVALTGVQPETEVPDLLSPDRLTSFLDVASEAILSGLGLSQGVVLPTG